jgi:membrane-anchored glycerophosphoryl diester phosphodiesterase (GDPDase)
MALGLILLGFLCLILPGFYLAVAFELSLPLLLTQDLTPWQALVRSRQYVHQQLGDFIMLSLTLVVINGIAALLFALPLLWTLPATCGAAALVAAQVLGWRQRPA